MRWVVWRCGHRSALARRRSKVGRRRLEVPVAESEARSARCAPASAELPNRSRVRNGYSGEVVLVRPGRGGRPRRHVELRVQVAHVSIHRPLADPESVGDLVVRSSARELVQHLELARTETMTRARRRPPGLPARAPHQALRRLVARRSSRARQSRCRRARDRHPRSRPEHGPCHTAHRAAATGRTPCGALEGPRAVCLRRAGPAPPRGR